jgi:hypothetical protein
VFTPLDNPRLARSDDPLLNREEAESEVLDLKPDFAASELAAEL